ncbi:MAG: PEP-CTERM sorting domain-containing protein [Pirellulales bacterium]|nr:PEP-CTERM sorting domain-containing protein [Pirellulales bacterium]
MSKNTMKWTLGLLAVGCMLAIAAPAGAEVINTLDSANFDWKYEMDAKPSAEDLDANSTMDFSENGSGMSVSGGVLTVIGSNYTNHFESSKSGELWPVKAFSHERGYTFEIRMKIAPTVVEGTFGLCMLGASPGDVLASDAYGYIKKTGIGWYDVVNGYHVISGTEGMDNADGEWHTFRVAQEPNSGTVGNEKFTIWRDGFRVAKGIDGYPVVAEMITFGDRSSTKQKGTFDVDYFRFTDGAYAPIPEPGTLALLVTGLIGLLCYAWRKRK